MKKLKENNRKRKKHYFIIIYLLCLSFFNTIFRPQKKEEVAINVKLAQQDVVAVPYSTTDTVEQFQSNVLQNVDVNK